MGKIVVITGSAREGGNTAILADAFRKAAENAGHTVVMFDAAHSELGGCHACDTCYQMGTPCTFDDDFNKIAPDILDADGIVFASPVYWYGFPSQIKAVIDKLYCFYTAMKPIAGKKCALLACAADTDVSVFDGMLFTYRKTIELVGWKSQGEVLATRMENKGDAAGSEAEKQAANLAAKFA